MNDNLTEYMYTTARFGNRVAMWHEAGHAVVAMHLGVKVFYYGLSPLPHCLVMPVGLSKHNKGVLLCAGAAMTKAMYGQEWGGDCADWRMAEALGDLEVFKAEAYELCLKLLPEAKYLVQQRMGVEKRPEHLDPQWWGNDPEQDLPELTQDSPHYAACEKAARKGVLPEWAKKAVMVLARFQMRNPRLMAKFPV